MHKQVIVIRSDLRMSKGKTAVQVAHASLSAAMKSKKTALKAWQRYGQKKVVLKANFKKLLQLREKCQKSKIPFCLVVDAGLTELKAGEITALALGPDRDKKIDKITGSLPLLR